MKNNLKKLLEYQINKSLESTINTHNININNLNDFIKSIIKSPSFDIKIECSDDKVKKKLVYLLDNSPDFICLNKTLYSMTKNFITICKKDNINTSEITEDYINTLLISYIESTI
tara:strand:- start:1409 stop:1753 length:345 start_codon:yes stop_codon:yes gene_type:complete